MKNDLRIFLCLTVIVFSCDSNESTNLQSFRADTVQYEDGYYVKYYTTDSVNIDSLYHYKYHHDTVILTDIVIENTINELEQISISRTNDSITITSKYPQYDYVAIFTKDSSIWGSDFPNNSISIYQNDSAYLTNGYLQVWRIIELGDTIGSIGIQTNKLINLENIYGW